MIHQPLLGGDDWTRLALDRDARARLKGQNPAAVWVSAAEAETALQLGQLVAKKLHALGRHTFLLDGGAAAGDSPETLTRLGEDARLLVDAGLIVIAPLCAARSDLRRLAQDALGADLSREIHIAAAGAAGFEASAQPLLRVDGPVTPAVAEQVVRQLLD